jgi:AGZA family xanthine/uracil permease-like MFS transporter
VDTTSVSAAPVASSSFISRFFELERRRTTVTTELRGAAATFLTMAYILVANPAILSAAGVPFGPAVSATAAAAAICSLLMGLGANFPIALASGMGLNAVVAFQVAPAVGSWQTAMGLIVLDGAIVLVLVLLGLREAVMTAIPRDLRRAIGVGIGLFIAFIGLVNARLVLVPAGTVSALARDPNAIVPPVTFGTLRAPQTAVALIGLVVIAFLMARRVTGAIVLGIVASTVVALVLRVTSLPSGAWLAAPRFDTVLQANVAGALHWQALPLLLSVMMVDFFDTIGTASAIAEEAGLEDESGRIPGLKRILVVDSLSASVGGMLGASSVTSYIESAAGVAEGARTGLHSVFVGLMFAIAIFAAPLAGIVPGAATAPALIAVGFLMCTQITRIDFRQLDTAIPAFILLITIPFTYSISHGIGYGFIAFVAIKLLSGQPKAVHPLMYLVAVAFAMYFLFS